MCGRFAISSTPQSLQQHFGYVEKPNFPPRYNIAPSEPVPIIRQQRNGAGVVERHFALMRWGFLPGFVKDPKGFPLLINARSETLLQKASFKNAVKRRRCLFFADAFYEWRRGDKIAPSQPFLVKRSDGTPMAFAGLWETWMGPNGEEVDTACIVTTAANGATAAIHGRLPAILEPRAFDLWLDISTEHADEALALLRPPENDVLDFFEIGPAVNKVANDFADIQLPAKPSAQKPIKREPVPEQGSLF